MSLKLGDNSPQVVWIQPEKVRWRKTERRYSVQFPFACPAAAILDGATRWT